MPVLPANGARMRVLESSTCLVSFCVLKMSNSAVARSEAWRLIADRQTMSETELIRTFREHVRRLFGGEKTES